MDLQQEWLHLSEEMALTDKDRYQPSKFPPQSGNVLSNVIFKLKWKLRWIRIINLPVLIAALFLKGDLQTLLIAFFVIYESFYWIALHQFNNIKTSVDYTSTTKVVLENNLKAIKSILNIENLFGYIFIPIAGPTGWLAAKLVVHHDFERVFKLPNFTMQIIITTLIGLPLILLAKKINQRLFSTHLRQLKIKIQELKE